ncbi:uncharacterized protein ACR2FA_011956 [Aphomia sociella]
MRKNMNRHLRLKHPLFFWEMQASKEPRPTSPGKRSAVWNYFDELPDKSVICKLCKAMMRKNMVRHLKLKHHNYFNEMEATKGASSSVSTKGQDSTSVGKCWTRRYCKRAGDMMFACIICGVVLRMPDGLFSNMKRHIKSKHPDVYKKESDIAKKALLETLMSEDI